MKPLILDCKQSNLKHIILIRFFFNLLTTKVGHMVHVQQINISNRFNGIRAVSRLININKSVFHWMELYGQNSPWIDVVSLYACLTDLNRRHGSSAPEFCSQRQSLLIQSVISKLICRCQRTQKEKERKKDIKKSKQKYWVLSAPCKERQNCFWYQYR